MVPWTTDAGDLVAGMHRCQVLLDDRFSVPRDREDQLEGFDEIALYPYMDSAGEAHVVVGKGSEDGVRSTVAMLLVDNK